MSAYELVHQLSRHAQDAYSIACVGVGPRSWSRCQARQLPKLLMRYTRAVLLMAPCSMSHMRAVDNWTMRRVPGLLPQKAKAPHRPQDAGRMN